MPESVSTIITTFNYARFIAPALDSVLGQTVRPDEIVVVDDGSTDQTEAIVEPYLARGVRYVKQERGGAGAARNRGLLETHGDLVTFLDADDRWLPDKLARQLEHLRCYPQAGLVTAGEWEVYESGAEPKQTRRRAAGAVRAYPQVLVENFIGNPSVVLVRRKCFSEVGVFDESLRLGQDWDMWIRIAQRFPVGVIDRPLILYTKHAGSLTTGQTDARYDSNQLIHRRYIENVTPSIRRALVWRGARSMNDFYTAAAIVDVQGMRRRALGLAIRALWLDPVYKYDLKLPLLMHAMIGTTAFTGLTRRVRRGTRETDS